MGQENRENPKGVLLQYDNILKDSYVLEHGKNPAFKKQYEHASRIVCEAVQNAQHIQDGEFRHHSNNVIAFTGDRGMGKTSAMISFQWALKDFNPERNEISEIFSYSSEQAEFVKRSRYITLPCVDVNALKENDDIIEIILARMLNNLVNFVKNATTRTRNSYQERLRGVYQEFDAVFRNFRYLRSAKVECISDGESALHTLQTLSSSQTVINSFAKLVTDYLDFFDWAGENSYSGLRRTSFLVIALDDVDRYDPRVKNGATKDVYTLMEQIYDYLMFPRIIVLLSTTDFLLRKSCTNHLQKQYEMSELDVYPQTNQFITKIIPSHRVVQMPDFRHNVWSGELSRNQCLEIELPQEMAEKLGFEKTAVVAKQLTPHLLAARTGLYFDAKGIGIHFFDRRNIRDEHDFLKLLDEMKSEPSSSVIVQNCNRLLDYITSTFYSENLHDKGLKFFEELLTYSIGYRSEKLLDRIGTENMRNEAYSCGNLFWAMYQYSRTAGAPKRLVQCILALYTAELNQLYFSCTAASGKDAELAHKTILDVMGTSISGRWTNKMLPEVKCMVYAPIPQQNMKIRTDSFWASDIENIQNIYMVSAKFPKDGGWEKLITDIVRSVEVQMMFFTNLKAMGVEKPFAFKIAEEQSSTDRSLVVSIENKISGNFGVFNFCVNSFDWKTYFAFMEEALIRAFKNYFESIKHEMPQSRLRKAVEDASMRHDYEVWSAKYGSLAVPIHQFDLTYNSFKRLANPSRNGMPPEIDSDKALGYCCRAYNNLSIQLGEQTKFYKGSKGSSVDFQAAFEECPFVKEIFASQNNKQQVSPVGVMLREFFKNISKQIRLQTSMRNDFTNNM